MNTKEFLEKLSTSEELQKKFEGVNKAEKFYEIAKENGLTDDFETMKAQATAIMKEHSDNEEVDLDKLSEISGGDAADVLESVASVTAAVTLASGAGMIAMTAWAAA